MRLTVTSRNILLGLFKIFLFYAACIGTARAQDACSQPNAVCVPIEVTPWRYYADFGIYWVVPGFYDSASAAYAAAEAWMPPRFGSNCELKFGALSGFTEYSRDMGELATMTMTYRTVDPSKYGCNGWGSGSMKGTIQRDRQIKCPKGSMYQYRASGSKCLLPGQPLTVSLTASAPIIPKDTRVVNRKVLTEVELVAAVQENGAVRGGKIVSFESDRNSTIDQFVPAKAITSGTDGKATATVTTRDQPGKSTISALVDGKVSPSPKTIDWLPAKYAENFLVTCYTIANEQLARASSVEKNVCGLPEAKTYRTTFLKDVKMQGSGIALDGATVHYAGNQCYEILSCAKTASGACAAAGTTIAVDMTVIPRRSSVNVAIIGSRKAQDTGGMIKGYHIDEFVGPQPELCKQMGRRTSAITLDSY